MILCENCSPSKQCTADKSRTECKFYQPMTEQEYLQTCNTEQLAEILLAIYQDGIDDCKQEWWKDTKEDFVEWLKQPHTEKER